MSKPFEATFATLRHGAASIEATEKLAAVVKSVYDTGKACKLCIELTVKPNSKNRNSLESVIILDKIEAKLPPEHGESVLFVNSDLELVANNSRQLDLMPEIPKSREFVDVDEDGVVKAS